MKPHLTQVVAAQKEAGSDAPNAVPHAANVADLTSATIMMVNDGLITMEVVQTFLEEAG